jgi:hypothetical protein
MGINSVMKNRPTKYRTFFFLCLIFPVFAQATIYQKVDMQGKIYFSYLQTSDSTPFVLKPINTYSSLPKKQSATETEKQTKAEKNRYQHFVLKQPSNQENFQNTATVLGMLEIEPSLQEGDRIQWWLDGKRVEESKRMQYRIPSLDRGEHSLQASLVDMKSHILMQTEKVTFYIHLPTT